MVDLNFDCGKDHIKEAVMKIKLFKKLLTIGLPLVVAVCIFIGCATTSGGEENVEPGTLTITGIPAEYAGKFVHMNRLSVSVTGNDGKKSNIDVIAQDTAVKNGEVKLPLYVKPLISIPFSKPKGYAGSDTSTIEISFRNSASSDGGYYDEPDGVFESVTFKSGVAEAKWEDAAKAGYLTITGIPAQYNDRGAQIFIGWVPPGTSKTPQGRWLSSNTVKDGAIIRKIYPKEKQGDNYESYNFTGTKDIMVAIGNGKEGPLISVIGSDPSYDYFLFKDAQITNGKITLDLRRIAPAK